jgi:hypothetical protein
MGAAQKHAVADTANSNGKRTRATYHSAVFTMHVWSTEIDEHAVGGASNIHNMIRKTQSAPKTILKKRGNYMASMNTTEGRKWNTKT